MSILPHYSTRFTTRFLKESLYPDAVFQSVEISRGIRVLILNQRGVIIRLHGVHAKRWITEHRQQLDQDFAE